MTTLTFQNTTLSVIDQNNQKWIPALEVGRALDYKNPSSDIAKLYERNKDEFTSSMTAIIDMDTTSGIQKVRIFSLRGCWLLGMRSHTKVAKDFRKWVLDILDREILQNSAQIVPLEPKPDVVLPHEKAEQIAKYLVRARAFAKEVEVFHRKLYEDLGIPRYIKNDIAAKGYDIACEFNYWIDPFIHQVLPQLATKQIAKF